MGIQNEIMRQEIGKMEVKKKEKRDMDNEKEGRSNATRQIAS
jgi:hypothetical protein